MKRHIIITSAILGLFAFTGCEDMLDVEPTTAIEAEGAVTDFTTLERSALGAYSALQGLDYYGQRYLLYQDLYTDNLTFSGTFPDDYEVFDKRINASNYQISSTWAGIYTVINRANIVIRDAERLTNITDEQRTQIVGEMKFLRALAHFDLVKVFGGVPIVTTPTTTIQEIQSLARATEQQVYEAIITDLLDAETKLEGTGGNEQATGFAATALLARVYLQQGNYTQAAAKANAVVTNGPYQLVADFGSMFTVENSQEAIFELAFSISDQNGLGTASDPRSGGQRFYVSEGAYNALAASAENGDERFEATTRFELNRDRLIKYDDVTNNADNVIILRLAEMYLIRAEATARLTANGGANVLPATVRVIRDINMIRERAGLNPVFLLTNQQALDEILEQRRLEFVGEGLRFIDLKRYNQTCELLGFCEEDGEDFRNLWPIPLQQIEVNPNLTQNPGY